MTSVKGQELLPDSLLSKSNSEKIIYLNEKAYAQNHIDSALIYTEKAIQISEHCECDSLKLANHFNKAYFLYHQGFYEEAISQLKRLDSINQPIQNNYYAFKTNSLLGGIHSYNNNSRDALKHTEKALDLSIMLKDSLLIGESYYNLGYLYFLNKLDEQSKKYLLKSIETYTQINAPQKLRFSPYLTLRDIAKSYTEFKYYNNLCFECVKSDDASSLAYIHVTASTVLIDKRFDISEAKRQAEIGHRISDSINYIPLKKIALYNLGLVENEYENYEKAIAYFEASKKINDGNHENYLLELNGLAQAYSQIGNHKKASLYKDEIIKLKDSIHQINVSTEFAKFDAKFQSEQKDKEIALQQLEITKQKSARNNWIFLSIASLLCIIGVFQWLSYRQKRKKIAIETELQKEQDINDIRSKFLGNIAHEIRTPLTLISGNLNLALDNFDKSQKAQQNIKVALENTKKITQDANDILELLKFEKNKTTINNKVVNLDDTLKRIVLSFKSLADMKDVNLEYKSNIANDYLVKIDAEKTEKIINNLISNALKYSPSNKSIIVNSQCKNDLLTLKVIDFGVGVSFNETEKIFERFYQSKNSESIGGIGIGLSLSREFAELMNGTLNVKSELDKGCTFILTLPAKKLTDIKLSTIKPEYKEDPLKPTNSSNESKVIETTTKSKILITEDNPQMASYLKDILSDRFDCTLAFDGKEALEKLKTETFDLITSDIMMPKMDGFELRKALNKNQKQKDIPFILISAKTLEEDILEGFSLGIDDYIVKPFSKNELVARINSLITNKKSREAWKLENKELLSDTESSDQKLLKKAERFILKNIDNEDFKIQELSDHLGYSQRQLTRILKQNIGLTPVQFILEIRLQKAYHYLQHKSYFTLSEVRYNVGINSSAYFNKKFKERFGINPSELLS